MKLVAIVLTATMALSACGRTSSAVTGLTAPAGTYRFDDGSSGRAMDILPAGANGLVTAQDLRTFGALGRRPRNSADQVAPYNNLIYGNSTLTDAKLSDYYLDESFGVKPSDVVRTERPNPKVKVVIYRDKNDIPHIYGASLDAMAYGAGYAGAEDRLFLMDLLRHYGRGHLMAFVGNACDYEQMDYQAVMSKGYTEADLQAQLNSLPKRYGTLGTELLSMIHSYVAGINLYISKALKNPAMMPVEYLATHSTPQPWNPTDVVAVSTLIALEATGGGDEVKNAGLLDYLDATMGSTDGAEVFNALKEQNDPAAPTTVVGKNFPYMIPSGIDPSLTAMPDDPGAAQGVPIRLTGNPIDTTVGCTGGSSAQTVGDGGTSAAVVAQQRAQADASAASAMTGSGATSWGSGGEAAESNAVVISAAHSADGHPIAVFGPEVGYYDPEILMQEDLHAPGYEASGAAFPGANFVVELGRGTDYAWSATTASTDQVDMRVEEICNPAGGVPASQGTDYIFDGKCRAMERRVFSESWPPGPRSTATTTVNRTVYYTIHGVVQGWTTVDGRPVAITRQDSTTGHDIDQIVGYLRFGMPTLSDTPQGWMQGVNDIAYSFNWFYLDPHDIAYDVSGRDPIRDPHADPNLPTWGTGVAEWQGFLPPDAHPHEIDPKDGYLVSWNNKSAPEFSASDDLYAEGPVFRSQLLTSGLTTALKAHDGKLTRAQLVAIAENAATQDLDGYSLLPSLLHFIGGDLNSSTATGVGEMIVQLQKWASDGFHREKGAAADTQYQDAAAVAIWDEVYPLIVEAIFDPIFAAGGVESFDGLPDGYDVMPMLFSETPDDVGQHDGDGFYSGWEGYVLEVIDQLEGKEVGQPFPSSLLQRICNPVGDTRRSGLASCRMQILQAFSSAYASLLRDNGGSTDVASWTQDTNTATEAAAIDGPVTIPEYDDIQFQQVGAIPLSTMDWENRPTYQQVVEFPTVVSLGWSDPR